MKASASALLCALLFCATSSISAQLEWISSAGVKEGYQPGTFVDGYGRTRLFHGIDAVQKGTPWYVDELLSNQTISALFEEWGFNFVRLGYMWSGAQPSNGTLNQTYLDYTKKTVDLLASHGIYTMFDMHQDGFSSHFCLYDGIPEWVFEMRETPRHEFPWPLSGSCDRFWETNFFAEALGQAYQDLYNNHNGMQDDLVSFWEQTAAVFHNESSIIGFELINEPWAGDVYKDPLLLLPGKAGRENLMPMYDKIAAAIRQHDRQHIIFYEPVTWGMVFDGKISGSGFDHVPGGSAWQNVSAYSYHWYCPIYQEGKPEPPFDRIFCDDIAVEQVFSSVKEELANIGGAGMMTEWGLCNPDTEEGLVECNQVMDIADSHFQSWSLWEISQITGTNADADHIATFSRTYAQAIAGFPTLHKYSHENAAFELCFNASHSKEAPTSEAHTTRIYANFKANYPDGHVIYVTPDLVYKEEGNIVVVNPSSQKPVPGEESCVKINRSKKKHIG